MLFEENLFLVQNPKYRNAFEIQDQLQHSTERNSHTNPIIPLEKRIGRTCNELDDEIHFLVDCQMSSDEHYVLFTKIHEKVPNPLNFNTWYIFTFHLKSNDSIPLAV